MRKKSKLPTQKSFDTSNNSQGSIISQNSFHCWVTYIHRNLVGNYLFRYNFWSAEYFKSFAMKILLTIPHAFLYSFLSVKLITYETIRNPPTSPDNIINRQNYANVLLRTFSPHLKLAPKKAHAIWVKFIKKVPCEKLSPWDINLNLFHFKTSDCRRKSEWESQRESV